jgi:hypothetical protein
MQKGRHTWVEAESPGSAPNSFPFFIEGSWAMLVDD